MTTVETQDQRIVQVVGELGGLPTVLCTTPCSERGKRDGNGEAQYQILSGKEVGVRNLLKIGRTKYYPVCYAGGRPRGICNWHR